MVPYFSSAFRHSKFGKNRLILKRLVTLKLFQVLNLEKGNKKVLWSNFDLIFSPDCDFIILDKRSYQESSFSLDLTE